MLVLTVVYSGTSLLYRVSSVEQSLCQGKPKHKAFRASEGVKASRIQDLDFHIPGLIKQRKQFGNLKFADIKDGRFFCVYQSQIRIMFESKTSMMAG